MAQRTERNWIYTNMKRILLLSILYISLEIGICTELQKDELDTSKELDETSKEFPVSIDKRSTAYKRLPGWAVYYGKRSAEPDFHTDGLADSEMKLNELDIIRELNQIDDGLIEESKNEESKNEDKLPFVYNSTPSENGPEIDDESVSSADKRTNFKRLQTWMTTYGKRSDKENSYFDSGLHEFSADGLSDEVMRYKLLNEGAYNQQSDFDISEFKRAPGWAATYGKRAPGWSVTYGKRAPGWAATYGKRAPGWAATYGKRLQGSSEWYGKRIPGWSVTYGKRAPGWTATYGKRAPGWSATYGKRAPGWAVTYGKRAPGWAATYGKRAPGWYATYGKRAPEWSSGSFNDMDAYNVDSDIIDSNRESAELDTLKNNEDKRAQAWSAFYGR